MADIVAGLFGLSPAQIDLQRRKEQEVRAMNQAQLAPAGYGNIVYGASQLGYGLGQGLGELFGVQDPELKKAKTIENILTSTQAELGEGVSDPTQLYGTIVNKLRNAGLEREAIQATIVGQKEIQDWNKNQAEIAYKNAQTIKEGQLKKPDIVQLQEALDTELAKGEAGNKDLISSLRDNIRKKNYENPESQAEQAVLDQFIKESGGDAAKGSLKFADWKQKNKEKVASAAAPIDKSAGAVFGKYLVDNRNAAVQSIDAANTVNRLRKVADDPKLIIGPGSDIKTNLERIAVTYLGKKDAGALSSTRVALQGIANLALNARSRLQGTGSISNYEQEVISKASTAEGLGSLTREELKALLDVVERDARTTHSNYIQMWGEVDNPKLKNAYKIGDLPEPYKPSTSKVEIVPGKKYTTEELKALQDEIKGK